MTTFIHDSASDVLTPPKYVAIKVLTVNATAGVLNNHTKEINNIKLITSTNPQHPGHKHCLTLRSAFLATSKHGPHICAVTDVLGSDLRQLQSIQPGGVFSVPVVKRIVKQTLLALDYLHSECKLVHTDVKPDNTMVSLANADAAIQAYLEQHPSATYEPRNEPDLSPDPIITVKSQPLPNFGLDPTLSNLDVRVIDYGQAASVADGLLTGEAQPVLLRAPEITLGHPWSTPVDIWSVGCLVFEYLLGTALFQLYESDSVTFGDVHLRRIIEHIGPFPAHFLARCDRRSDFFDAQGI
jgi:serine/threonine-protein kinase SRPK3